MVQEKKKKKEKEVKGNCKIVTDYSTRVKTLISAASPLYCPKSGSALTRMRTMGRKVIQAPETTAVNFSKVLTCNALINDKMSYVYFLL